MWSQATPNPAVLTHKGCGPRRSATASPTARQSACWCGEGRTAGEGGEVRAGAQRTLPAGRDKQSVAAEIGKRRHASAHLGRELSRERRRVGHQPRQLGAVHQREFERSSHGRQRDGWCLPEICFERRLGEQADEEIAEDVVTPPKRRHVEIGDRCTAAQDRNAPDPPRAQGLVPRLPQDRLAAQVVAVSSRHAASVMTLAEATRSSTATNSSGWCANSRMPGP